MIEIILGVSFFTGIVLILVGLILAARSKLVASGNVTITINDNKLIETPIGGKLLGALGDAKIFVSSACGGGGTCGVCRVKVFEGGGAILPTETSHITKREAREGYRLSCQVAVKPISIWTDASCCRKASRSRGGTAIRSVIGTATTWSSRRTTCAAPMRTARTTVGWT
jgi:Na+-transporting NADH:ubiquinone oxidoreductase subunit NqrF